MWTLFVFTAGVAVGWAIPQPMWVKPAFARAVAWIKSKF